MTTQARLLWEKPRSSWIDGSATFTIVASRTIISMPAQSTYSAAQRVRSVLVSVVTVGSSSGRGHARTTSAPAGTHRRSPKTGGSRTTGVRAAAGAPARGRTPRAARGRARRAAARRRAGRSAGPSATTRPASRITARSHSSAASGRSCVRDQHRALDALRGPRAARGAPRGSRLAEGSSSTSSARAHGQHGGDRHAAALAHRELVRRAVARRPAMRTAASASRDPRAPPRRGRGPRFSGPNATSSPTVGMKSWSSGSWKTSPTRARSSCSVAARRPQPGDLELALPVSSAVEVEHERRLAGAVGAEQRDALAVADVQVDAAQRGAAARVAVAQAAGVDGAAHAQHAAAGRARAATSRDEQHVGARERERRGARHACRDSRGRASRGAPARRAPWVRRNSAPATRPSAPALQRACAAGRRARRAPRASARPRPTITNR